jgi:hypothetical protein
MFSDVTIPSAVPPWRRVLDISVFIDLSQPLIALKSLMERHYCWT